MTARDENSIRSEIRSFILEHFLLSTDEYLDNDTPLLENGILDSTGALELAAFLEGTFQIKIDEREIVLENIDSLDRLVAFVARKIS